MNNQPSNANQPILFVDLDGTLIKSTEFHNASRCALALEHSKNPQEAEKDLPFYMSADSVAMIRDLRARHNAKLVIHSNWTVAYMPQVTFNELLRHGFEASDFHHDWCLSVNLYRLSLATPRAKLDYNFLFKLQDDNDGRQWRIPMWLMLHPEIDNFAIFDDRSMNEWEKNNCTDVMPERKIGCNLVGDWMNGPFHSRWVRVTGKDAITEQDIDKADVILAKADTACVWRL